MLGALRVFQAELVSNTTVNFVLEVTEALYLDHCTVTAFQSLPIHVRRQVQVQDCWFRDNGLGVFASRVLGGSLTVTQSRFSRNAGTSGAVFFLYPVSRLEATFYSVSKCAFEGNGVKHGSSVLALNDFGANSTESQTVSFSKCPFREHPVAAFQLQASCFYSTLRNAHSRRKPR